MISVIIPTIHHTDLVKNCVHSFINSVHDLPYEIIVVDDGSSPDIQQQLQQWAAPLNVQVIAKPSNEGFSRSVNQGIHHSQGEFILLVNSDIIFHEPGWLHQMLATMDRASNIGIVGARLLYPNLTIQHGGVFPTRKGYFDHRFRGQAADFPPALVVEDLHAVTGALMLVRRQLLAHVGLLSEEYFIAFEDVDFCYRAKQHGFRVLYCGTACALHFEGYTRGTNSANKNQFWHQKEREARKKFWMRWGGSIIR